MPEKKTTERAKGSEPEGRAPSKEAGELVREEMHKMKEGEGAESPEQAIAIGLSRARRAGIDVPVPPKGKASERVRRKAAQDIRKGKEAKAKRSAPRRKAAGREDESAPRARPPAKKAPAEKGRGPAARRTRADRSAAARKAAATRKRRKEEGQSG